MSWRTGIVAAVLASTFVFPALSSPRSARAAEPERRPRPAAAPTAPGPRGATPTRPPAKSAAISTDPRPCEPPAPGTRVGLEIDGASLESFVGQVGRTLCRNLTVDARVAKTPIIAVTPVGVPIEALWGHFLAILATHELTIVDVGAITHVISGTDATRSDVPTYDVEAALPNEERMITKRVLVPAGVDANAVTNYLNIFKSKRGQIHPWHGKGGAFLTITDYTSSVRRLLALMPG
jgi:type II secretory pathway component GspD/PulD (secretin)